MIAAAPVRASIHDRRKRAMLDGRALRVEFYHTSFYHTSVVRMHAHTELLVSHGVVDWVTS